MKKIWGLNVVICEGAVRGLMVVSSLGFELGLWGYGYGIKGDKD